MDYGEEGYVDSYLREHPQHRDLVTIGKYIVELKPSYQKFREDIGQVIRQAYDEVIDMPRTRRWSLDELASTEKTYIGTKVEILIQHWLGLERGESLDLSIDGQDVDVKNTIGSNWMIPTEAVGQICLLIRGSLPKSKFSVGLIRANGEYLNPGGNKDRKRTVTARHFDKIFWLAFEADLPKNFFYDLDDDVRSAILTPKSGAARVRELFRRVLLTVIPRGAIEGAANQKDALKRVRRNGGAREQLLAEGILILSGKYDAELVADLGLPVITSDQFISVPRAYVAQHLGKQDVEDLFG